MSKIIHPIIISQAPKNVQEANVKLNNVIQIFESEIGKNNKIITTSLRLLSQLEEQYGIPAGDYYTGNYTGLWTCKINGHSVIWSFVKTPNAVATTFPTTDIISIKLPFDIHNTYWTCYPNHSVGIPTLAHLQTSPVISMSVYQNECWKKL